METVEGIFRDIGSALTANPIVTVIVFAVVVGLVILTERVNEQTREMIRIGEDNDEFIAQIQEATEKAETEQELMDQIDMIIAEKKTKDESR